MRLLIYILSFLTLVNCNPDSGPYELLYIFNVYSESVKRFGEGESPMFENHKPSGSAYSQELFKSILESTHDIANTAKDPNRKKKFKENIDKLTSLDPTDIRKTIFIEKGAKGANYKFKNGIQTNRMYNYKSEDKPSLSNILNKVYDESLTSINKMSIENKQKFVSKIQPILENIQKERYKDIVALRDGIPEIDKKSILEKNGFKFDDKNSKMTFTGTNVESSFKHANDEIMKQAEEKGIKTNRNKMLTSFNNEHFYAADVGADLSVKYDDQLTCSNTKSD